MLKFGDKILKKTEHYLAMIHKTKNVPKGLRNSTMFGFFSKNAYFSQFRMISVGGAK